MTSPISEHAQDPNATGSPVATLSEVSVHYARPGGRGVVKALDGVSCEATAGELLVLVGRSGCGKTTALNVLAGLVEPTHGQASVLGAHPVVARKRLGYMFARDALLPWRTAARNIELGLEVRGLSRAEREAVVAEYLELVHLSDYADNYPGQLSQGQRQRVALARTWATSPEILLMDEPFAALDAETRASLHAQFLRLWERDQRTIIFVTHDINEAIALADRILVFDDGHISREFEVRFPRPRDLLDITVDPAAREMYRSIRDILAGRQ